MTAMMMQRRESTTNQLQSPPQSSFRRYLRTAGEAILAEADNILENIVSEISCMGETITEKPQTSSTDFSRATIVERREKREAALKELMTELACIEGEQEEPQEQNKAWDKKLCSPTGAPKPVAPVVRKEETISGAATRRYREQKRLLAELKSKNAQTKKRWMKEDEWKQVQAEQIEEEDDGEAYWDAETPPEEQDLTGFEEELQEETVDEKDSPTTPLYLKFILNQKAKATAAREAKALQ